MDEEGYLYVMSRVDDMINVAGHRISAGAIEEVKMKQPGKMVPQFQTQRKSGGGSVSNLRGKIFPGEPLL